MFGNTIKELFVCLLALTITVNAFRRQSTAVKGRLLCASEPAAEVLVKLFDQDDGPDPDDLLDSTYTDKDGYFELKGDTVEFTNIDPEIRIYHTCAMHIKFCKREWVIGIPDKYITYDRTPERIMDIGSVNLEVELEDESRDCLH